MRRIRLLRVGLELFIGSVEKIHDFDVNDTEVLDVSDDNGNDIFLSQCSLNKALS